MFHPHEPTDFSNPASQLEEREEAAQQDEVAFVFGRLLSWLFQGRSLEHVGFRAHILAYHLRPDLIQGMTLEEIAGKMGHGRSHAHNLSTELSLTFGIRSRNQHRQNPPSSYSRASLSAAHLPIVNRFAEWEGALNRAGINPRAPSERDRLAKDFAPVIRFVQTLMASQ